MEADFIRGEQFNRFVEYHCQGDPGAEGKILANVCEQLRLEPRRRFELVWCYQATYHVPSALRLFFRRSTPMDQLKFRTDRRFMRCNGAFQKNMAAMTATAYDRLTCCRTTTEAFRMMTGFPSVGRFAASLFLEVFNATNRPGYRDDFAYEWEPGENYTRGALLLLREHGRENLDKLFNLLKAETRDISFALETSLCAWEKIRKGTRWNGFYTERAVKDAAGTEYEQLILGAL
jgi:hypothetical protein